MYWAILSPMLTFTPKPGAILLCHFPACLQPPEMVKVRPIVVISPRLPGRNELVCVVPLSTTPPDPVCAHHYLLPIAQMPRPLQAEAKEIWAKCDMLYTFAISRLDRFKAGRDNATGKRKYESGQLDLENLRELRRCAQIALGAPCYPSNPDIS